MACRIARNLSLLAVLCVLPLSAGAQKAGRKLIFAAEDYPPYEYFQDGRMTGINVEVIRRIMERLGIPYEFIQSQSYPFTRVWLMVTKGSADACLSVSYQPSRENVLFFTKEQIAFAETGRMPPDYLSITEYVFFVNERFKNALRFDTYEQLKRDQYRVGVLKEYSYDRRFTEAELNRVVFITPAKALQALADNEIDLLPLDRTVGLWLSKQLGLSERVTYLPKTLFQKPYLVGFSRNSDYPDLEGVMRRFYEELRKMRESGELREIMATYLGPSEFRTIPRSLLFVCEEWAPYEYMENGVVKGIDVEVVDRILRKLKIPYEIRIYPWSRAWMMLQKGTADAVLSISYNKDREDVLYFTPEQRQFSETGVVPPDYLWLSEYVFFVKKKYADRIMFESFEQLKRDGYRIGTNKDYSYCKEFLEAKLSCREFPHTKAGMRALVAEEIDLYPMDKTVGLATLKEMGLAESVAILAKPIFTKPYLAPFSRISDYPDAQRVMMDFYGELRRMREIGELERIVASYLESGDGGSPAP